MNFNTTRDAEISIARAISFAEELDQKYCKRDHLLWALLFDKKISQILLDCNVNTKPLIEELTRRINNNGINVKIESNDPEKKKPTLTYALTLHLTLTQKRIENEGKDAMSSVDLFLSFFDIKNQVLNEEVLRVFSRHKITKAKFLEQIQRPSNQVVGDLPQKDYLINLNRKAMEGKVERLVGRFNEIERIVEIFSRKKKNNPILVGEPGVGKTAIVEGLALQIIKNQVPDSLRNHTVFSLDISQMVAGTKYRGDFEEKMKDMIKTITSCPNCILFIDEIHNIIGAGAASGGLDSANMLKPLLSTGEIKVIGASTYKEYNNIFERDSALTRRFQKIDIVEPTMEEALQICMGLKPDLEKHHSITYTDEAIKIAIELSTKHLTDRFLPDKAIDILDEAGAFVRLKESKKVVNRRIIEKTIAKIARIPEKTVTTDQRDKLKLLKSSLMSEIFGQDEAIDSVVSAVELASSGLRTGDKPIGSFLFCGPTGVGKTELCKQLSIHLEIPLIRFDMSEYMEKHAVSRLIGSPPGYVGSDQGGQLTDAVRKNPNCIILMDEIEKAHPDVWNILLQVMDHGALTDNNGKKADFKNAMIILTSNVGAQDMTKRGLGLGAEDPKLQKPTKAVERTFAPEFRNRLDATVYFNQLDRKNISDVLEKNLKELRILLKDKNVDLVVSENAAIWLTERGYSPQLGARPMARLVQDQIKKRLSSEILYGDLASGGIATVDVDSSGNLSFSFKTKQSKKKNVGRRKQPVC